MNDKIYCVVDPYQNILKKEKCHNVFHIIDFETRKVYKIINKSLNNSKYLFFDNYMVCYNFDEFIKITGTLVPSILLRKINLIDDSKVNFKYNINKIIRYGTKNIFHNNNVIVFENKKDTFIYDFEIDKTIKLPKSVFVDDKKIYLFKKDSYYSVYFTCRGLEIYINSNIITTSSEPKIITIRNIEFDLNKINQRTKFFNDYSTDINHPNLFGYNNYSIIFISENILRIYKDYIISNSFKYNNLYNLLIACSNFNDIDNKFIAETIISSINRLPDYGCEPNKFSYLFKLDISQVNFAQQNKAS